MSDVVIGLIITFIFLLLTIISQSNEKNQSKNENTFSGLRLPEPGYISTHQMLSYTNSSERVRRLSNKLKKEVKYNQQLYEIHKNKLVKYFDDYLPLNKIKLSPHIPSISYIKSYYKYDDESFSFTPFHEFVQQEFLKINCTLYNETLQFVGTTEYFFLYNKYGMIYTYPVERVSMNFNDYSLKILLPIEYLDNFEILYNNSKIKIELENEYFREVLKRISDSTQMLNLMNKIYVFGSNMFNQKKEYYKFCNQSIKENYKLRLKDSVNLLVSTKSISLLEYLINLELKSVEYDLELILYILFENRYVGSFSNRRKIDLKISDTSKKILSNEDLKTFYRYILISKKDFYYYFQIEEYLKNINLNILNSTEEYKKIFDYWVDIKRHSFYQNHPNPGFRNLETSVQRLNDDERRQYILEKLFINENYLELVDLFQKGIRDIENKVRVSKGIREVGGFVNETILYLKLKEEFNNYNVVSQGSTKWLGRQRIDIYFPDLNIGVEYHGDQHFYPIDYFGGEKGFENILKLDLKKKELCDKNNCKLFVVDKNYDIYKLITEIKEEIEIRKNTSSIDDIII